MSTAEHSGARLSTVLSRLSARAWSTVLKLTTVWCMVLWSQAGARCSAARCSGAVWSTVLLYKKKISFLHKKKIFFLYKKIFFFCTR